MSAPSAGAEMMTFFAPASRCFAAASRLVKIPVHSSATSTPSSRHGSLAGSRSAVTRILPRPASIQFSPVVTSPAKRPCTLSYRSRCALVSTGPRSLMPTTSSSLLACSKAARMTKRPILPNPLIATRIAMVRPPNLSVDLYERAGRLRNLLGRDAEMREERLTRRRRTVAGHSDKDAARPEPALPAELNRGLDSDPRCSAEDRVAIGLGLRLEQFPARHRHDCGNDTVARQHL